MHIHTGGEPMVRKADLIRICEMHPDCELLAFTNGTLIDEDFCRAMLRVKNVVPAISLEDFQAAMALLRSHKLPFGISICYTSANYDDISSEEYFDIIINAGALFACFFHYVPVGNNAVPELLPIPTQRKTVYERIRKFRTSKA